MDSTTINNIIMSWIAIKIWIDNPVYYSVKIANKDSHYFWVILKVEVGFLRSYQKNNWTRPVQRLQALWTPYKSVYGNKFSTKNIMMFIRHLSFAVIVYNNSVSAQSRSRMYSLTALQSMFGESSIKLSSHTSSLLIAFICVVVKLFW